MDVRYGFNGLRSRKSRAAIHLAQPSMIRLLIAIALLSLMVGATLLASGLRSGGLVMSIGVLAFMVWQWIEGDLKRLGGSALGNSTSVLDLSQVLDPYVLGRLPKKYSLSDVLIACSGSWQHVFFANRFGISPEDIIMQVDLASMHDFWQAAHRLAIERQSHVIDSGMLFVAAIQTIPGIDQWLASKRLSTADIVSGLDWQYHLKHTIDSYRNRDNFYGIGRDWNFGYTPLLSQFGHNITQEVENGGFIHRDTTAHRNVVDQMLKILHDTSRQNVVLVGDVGSGKSTTVYAFARRLLRDTKLPDTIRYHQIFNLSAPSLIANSRQPGQLEQTVIRIINEAQRAKNIILFFDEAYGFFSNEQSSADMSNLLLPVLEGGRMRLIFSMTPKQWQEVTRRNETLGGLFNAIVVKEPDERDTMRIMEDQILLLESQHRVIYSFFALKEALRLGQRYIHEIAFPGKGIRLLEMAATHHDRGVVTAQSVQQAIEQTKGVKVSDANRTETDILLKLEDRLHERVINQTKAVAAIANALRRARSGVGNPNRPVGTFMFLGPTGVGKTELSKALAAIYFGGEGHLVRVDMNEYTRSDDIQRFIRPGGSSGMGLVEQMRRQPYSVVLLDEIEKAHPDVINLLLQMLDEGKMKDSDEKEIFFRDAIIIATSNAGADEIRQRINQGQAVETMTEILTDQLINDGVFSPEFLNRFDEIVVFRPLSPEELSQVVDLLLAEVNITLAAKHVRVSVTDAAKQWLVKNGYDPKLGARPLRRVVQRTVENVVATQLLNGQLVAGGSVTLDVHDLESATK